ncbi:MAG: helix-turn-helix transcriptional regulator [Clostridia bacterium]|nr:helix-turn-helix transcriptional regulator [Clostridia bacterium]
MKEKGMTQYALFKKTGVPQSTISTLLTGNVQTIKLCTIHEICKGLEVEISEFFNKPYLKQKSIKD